MSFVYPSTSTIGAITAVPSGTATDIGTMGLALQAYTNGNFYRDNVVSLGPTLGNAAGGIGAMSLLYGAFPIITGQWQFAFSTPIPKDNTKTLSLTVRYSWGR